MIPDTGFGRNDDSAEYRFTIDLKHKFFRHNVFQKNPVFLNTRKLLFASEEEIEKINFNESEFQKY